MTDNNEEILEALHELVNDISDDVEYGKTSKDGLLEKLDYLNSLILLLSLSDEGIQKLHQVAIKMKPEMAGSNIEKPGNVVVVDFGTIDGEA